MNLYNLHDNPEQLKYNDRDKLQIPHIALKQAMRMKMHPGNDLTELEHTIAKDAKSSYRYANKVKRGRFAEGEPAILRGPLKDALRYFGSQFDFEELWPELAERIINEATPKQARTYAENLEQRFPEIEEIIKQDDDEWHLYQRYL